MENGTSQSFRAADSSEVLQIIIKLKKWKGENRFMEILPNKVIQREYGGIS